jgi:hypothetical protein
MKTFHRTGQTMRIRHLSFDRDTASYIAASLYPPWRSFLAQAGSLQQRLPRIKLGHSYFAPNSLDPSSSALEQSLGTVAVRRFCER